MLLLHHHSLCIENLYVILFINTNVLVNNDCMNNIDDKTRAGSEANRSDGEESVLSALKTDDSDMSDGEREMRYLSFSFLYFSEYFLYFVGSP